MKELYHRYPDRTKDPPEKTPCPPPGTVTAVPVTTGNGNEKDRPYRSLSFPVIEDNSAFDGCVNLQAIYGIPGGTTEEWANSQEPPILFISYDK